MAKITRQEMIDILMVATYKNIKNEKREELFDFCRDNMDEIKKVRNFDREIQKLKNEIIARNL